MTRKKGAIVGLIVGSITYGFFKWIQLGGTFTTEQVNVINSIFTITSLGFIGGFVIGIISLFQNRNVLGSTFADGTLLGFTTVFNGTSLVIALIQGQKLFSV